MLPNVTAICSISGQGREKLSGGCAPGHQGVRVTAVGEGSAGQVLTDE